LGHPALRKNGGSGCYQNFKLGFALFAAQDWDADLGRILRISISAVKYGKQLCKINFIPRTLDKILSKRRDNYDQNC
jgi:hypothetical protein